MRLCLPTEHTLRTIDDNGPTNMRTTLTKGLMRLLMWNMPFHAEHRLHPPILFYRLPVARAALRLGMRQRDYAHWHVGIVRMLRP